MDKNFCVFKLEEPITDIDALENELAKMPFEPIPEKSYTTLKYGFSPLLKTRRIVNNKFRPLFLMQCLHGIEHFQNFDIGQKVNAFEKCSSVNDTKFQN